LVLQHELTKLGRQSKDNMEVLAIKKLLSPFFDPPSSCRKATFRAVAVATRVVSVFIKVAAVALKAMSTEHARPAIFDRLNDFVVLQRHFPEQMTVFRKDVGDF